MASSSIPTAAVDVQGRKYDCRVPENATICQALLNKAASYPPEKKYNAQAYQHAAEAVVEARYSLPEAAAPASIGDGSCWVLDYTPAPLKFIREFFKNGGKLQCAHPDNQPIYEAILAKAAAYPPEKKYQAAACMKGAMVLAATPVSLKVDRYGGYDLDVGDSLMRFISDTITRVYPPTKHPENEVLFNRATYACPAAAPAIAAHPEKLCVDSNGLLMAYLPGLTADARAWIERSLNTHFFF
jgi:hypothetical protein